MYPNLKNAILQFLGNEFQLEPDLIREDTNFETDLGLDAEGIADLLTRLQDALDFPLPEEKFAQVHTIEDLLRLLGLETENSAL